MQVSVINIGKSKGIRLSKTLSEKYNIQDKLELIMEEGQIILKPLSNAVVHGHTQHSIRMGWEIAFKQMHQNGDDALLIDDVFG
jgi:antitoxin MazE